MARFALPFCGHSRVLARMICARRDPFANESATMHLAVQSNEHIRELSGHSQTGVSS